MKTRLVSFLFAAGIASGCSGLTAVVRDSNPIGVGAPRPAAPPTPEAPPPAPVAQPRVRVESARIAVDDKIHFNTGSAEIAAQSHELLNEIARVLRDNPRITKVRVEGHTDNVGAPGFNRRLSQQRAEAVRTYLTGQGIDGGRLQAQGFGPDRPVDSNDSEEGRSKNRRVEFNIVDQAPAEGGAQ